ncbi:hypothetical protein [Mycobacterium sp. HNNTM2301]|uniref:hypothetical protein n=1 Tax=Mycobacterium hainanense TaxID=3289775 RepID=UPI0035A5D533
MGDAMCRLSILLAFVAFLALAPPVYADVYAGGYDVSGCTISWERQDGGEGTISSKNCIDGFLALVHNSQLVSHPTGGQTSDRQLVSDGMIASWAYRKGGYGIDRSAAGCVVSTTR